MVRLSAAQGKVGRELGSAGAVADSKQTLLCTCLTAVLLVGLVLNATPRLVLGQPNCRPRLRRPRRQRRPRRLAGQGLLRPSAATVPAAAKVSDACGCRPVCACRTRSAVPVLRLTRLRRA
ncbi:hypothetical protein GCM10018775_80330 [Streptomyces umbrinus]|nr:hypothetical protein GCM10018775_80330 [Streptomyces umbrinus]